MRTDEIIKLYNINDAGNKVTYCYFPNQEREQAKESAHKYRNPDDNNVRWCCFKSVMKGKVIPLNDDTSYTVPSDGFLGTLVEGEYL